MLRSVHTNFFVVYIVLYSHVLYWDNWYPCFGFLVMPPLGFKAWVGSALFVLAEVNAMYIPWDPPLVLDFANLLMVSIVGQQFKMAAQHHHLPAHSPSLGLEWKPSHVRSSALRYVGLPLLSSHQLNIWTNWPLMLFLEVGAIGSPSHLHQSGGLYMHF